MTRLSLILLAALGACGGRTLEPSSGNDPASDVFRTTSFKLPDDGGPSTPDRGPFCCTEKTVVVELTDGRPAGFAYFYNWRGPAFQIDERTAVAPNLSIPVAAVPKLSEAGPPPDKSWLKANLVDGQIDFDASELKPGLARTTVAGSIAFIVTIDHVDIVSVSGAPYFNMATLTGHLDVEDVGAVPIAF